MTYDQLLQRLIDDGIAEVRIAYCDPKDHHKREGAVEGFEVCRGKTPAELVKLYVAYEEQTQVLNKHVTALADAHRNHHETYWHHRYAAMQVEFVCNVISVGLVNAGQPPLFGHLPTVRGAVKYAEVVGVRDIPTAHVTLKSVDMPDQEEV